PALQLAGFFEHFEPMRLQVIGQVETTYLEELTHEQRLVAFDRYFCFKIPALIIARGRQPLAECLMMAKKHGISLLSCENTTSEIVSSLISSLRLYLAPRVTRHGVLVDVYGEGLFLVGESGVGKSEAAVELIKRGHRLIADDAVEIRRVTENQLVGEAPELIRHYMEIRGIGVTNIAKLFGMGAVKDSSNIDLVINIEPWDDNEFYDRLGLEDNMTELLGVKVPSLTIPVKPGRNLAVIVEVAAMNNRQKKMGYNPAQEFTDQINNYMDRTV
ncbi:MAG: HPr(Ser) kinase/phosphatase, partial [Oscillospiraceae bacterium]|nr:HPr(Ser) kinase/phosphatase [Oscillospiraceae bacterium]